MSKLSDLKIAYDWAREKLEKGFNDNSLSKEKFAIISEDYSKIKKVFDKELKSFIDEVTAQPE